MSSDNPILDLLDEIGLPWRTSRTELTSRYGTRSDGPYETKVIPIVTRPPLLGGLLRPLEVLVFPQLAPDLPPLEFTGETSHGHDAGFNIRMAADDLRTTLGPAEVRKHWNTLRCEWTHGRSSVRLTAWPPEWQSPSTNHAHERDPRLITACHVTVCSGFRPDPSYEELGWIASFEPAATIRSRAHELARDGNLEFQRDVTCDASMRNKVGWSGDRQALIFCDADVHVVRASDIQGFVVQRILPAKGSGSSDLRVSCRTRIPACPVKQLTITTASGPDDLNDLGTRLAEALSKPCQLEPYEYDV